MCGIAGGWQHPHDLDEARLDAALTVMRHRGPDGSGTRVTPGVSFGMRRLAIIDLPGGQQPLGNEDGSVTVVFNGEIYNYLELMNDLRARGHVFRTRSDTETLVHLYEEYGPGMVDHLRGMFAFAIHDSRDDSLFIARDRLGKKPLYYTRTARGGLLFASELKALRSLARSCGERWTVSEQAVYDYLSLGAVPQPGSIYRGVYALPAGSWMRVRDDGVRVERYWRPTWTPKLHLRRDEILERARGLIHEAVAIRLRSDVPVGVFLSAGLDSSIVAYEASRLVGEQLQTFTIGVNDPRFDESPVARRTSERFGVHNTVLQLRPSPLESLRTLVRQYDQPFADSSAIPSLEVARLARQHVTVVLNGDGGDEIFAGYRRHIAAMQAARFELLPRPVVRAAADLLGRRAHARRTRQGFAARFARGLHARPSEKYLIFTQDTLRDADKRRVWRLDPPLATEDRIDAMIDPSLGPLDRQIAVDVELNLVSTLLVKMDIATMAHSVEARSPLLDHRVVEFATRLPERERLRGARTKSVLRDAYADVLPAEVLSRPKQGFEIPLEAWLQGELSEVVHDTLGSPHALVRDFVEGSFVDALLARSVMTDRNWASIVYALLVLELWLLEERQR